MGYNDQSSQPNKHPPIINNPPHTKFRMHVINTVVTNTTEQISKHFKVQNRPRQIHANENSNKGQEINGYNQSIV